MPAFARACRRKVAIEQRPFGSNAALLAGTQKRPIKGVAQIL